MSVGVKKSLKMLSRQVVKLGVDLNGKLTRLERKFNTMDERFNTLERRMMFVIGGIFLSVYDRLW